MDNNNKKMNKKMNKNNNIDHENYRNNKIIRVRKCPCELTREEVISLECSRFGICEAWVDEAKTIQCGRMVAEHPRKDNFTGNY